MSDDEQMTLTGLGLSEDLEDGLRDKCNAQSPRVIVNNEKNRCRFCFGFSLLITIVGVSILFLVPTYEHFQQTNTTIPAPSSITARVGAWPHGGGFNYARHHYSCNDGGFDCCYIYGIHRYMISPERVVGRDQVGSNCPSLISLLNQYNEYIEMYFTPKNCSEVKCCTIDVSRDASIRQYKTIPGGFEMKEEVCPTIQTVISKYEGHYPNPNQDTYFLISLMCFLLFIGVCIGPDKRGRGY